MEDINYAEQKTWFASVDYQQKWSEDLSADFYAHTQNIERESLGVFGDAGAPYLCDDYKLGPRDEFRDSHYAIDLHWRVNDDHRLLLGLNYDHSRVRHDGNHSNYDQGDPSIYFGRLMKFENKNDQRAKVKSFYLQDEWRIDNLWQATISARYDDYNQINDHAITPRLGLVYKHSQTDRFKFLYGEAFRAPTLAELFVNNSQIKSSADIKSVESKTYEAAWLHDADSYNSGITLFYNDVENTISRVSGRFQNAGDLESYDVELEASIDINSHWRLRGTYSYLFKNESTLEGDTLPEDFNSQQSGSLQLNYQRQRQRWNWNINGWFRGEAEALANQGSIAVFNSKLSFQYTDKLVLALNTKNLFHRDYDTIVTARGLGLDADGELVRAVPRPGRWSYLELRYFF